MGDKSQAKKAMIKAGVPVVPGSPGVVEDEDQARKVAKDVGFPVILKASAGGGGRGMRVVREMSELVPSFRAAQAEAAAAFGVPDVYIETLRGRAAPHRDPGDGRRQGQHRSTWASASARSSGATRRSSRRRRRRRSARSCASAWAARRWRPRGRCST